MIRWGIITLIWGAIVLGAIYQTFSFELTLPHYVAAFFWIIIPPTILFFILKYLVWIFKAFRRN